MLKYMKTLRDYQLLGRYGCNTLLNVGRHPLLVIPTGGGKTITAISLISDQVLLGKTIFILTPQEEIFNQWVYALAADGFSVGMINDKGVTTSKSGVYVYVCMPLALNNLLDYLPANFRPDIIITDEAHHSAADSWEKIYKKWSDALRMGLTATPQRTDGKGLDHLYTDIVETTNMSQLIADGNLARPLTIVPEQYLEKVQIKKGDYDPADQARQLGKPRIIGNVIQKYGQVLGGLPALAACCSFDHAAQMTDAFQRSGWRWGHIHSKLNRADRAGLLRDISNGKLNGLCTVGVGTEGLDIPGLYGLIWLRRTLSLTIYLQLTGRILRPAPGKDAGISLDFVGNTFIFGLPDTPRKWSLIGKGPAEESEPVKMKLCQACGTMNSPFNNNCHFCDHDLTVSTAAGGRKIPAMVDGNLVTVDGSDIPNLSARADLAKSKIKKELLEEKKSSSIPAELSRGEKVDILKTGLFEKNKRPLFNRALRKNNLK